MPASVPDRPLTDARATAYVYGHTVVELIDLLNGLEGLAKFKTSSMLLDQFLHPTHGVLEKVADLLEAAAEKVRESPSDNGWDLSGDLQYAAEQTRALVGDLNSDDLVERARVLRAGPAVRTGDASAAVAPRVTLPQFPATPRRRTH